MVNRELRISLAQLSVGDDKRKNLDKAEQAIKVREKSEQGRRANGHGKRDVRAGQASKRSR